MESGHRGGTGRACGTQAIVLSGMKSQYAVALISKTCVMLTKEEASLKRSVRREQIPPLSA